MEKNWFSEILINLFIVTEILKPDLNLGVLFVVLLVFPLLSDVYTIVSFGSILPIGSVSCVLWPRMGKGWHKDQILAQAPESP